ncbi:hypothetical protein [Streptomyces yaizuensis]|uniref:ABC transporter n=1 Tax=Streptomyces yaizuensis TaxID=2989713 RepID=A0ABQ5NW57_9ACTN|nr:hypothetical protein [Streptomyces sp. YSPA8]GLF94615.1 hypothetical protein SYYSPA8_09980 [Streptomyces sp. YSPA8]
MNGRFGYGFGYGLLLHARARRVPATAAVIVAAAVLAPGPGQGAPALLGPLAVAAAVGAGLRTHDEDLDRAAARRWWPLRAAQVLLLAALAVAALALAVPGPAVPVRAALGAVGVTAAAAVLFGARLSWVPTLLYLWPATLPRHGAGPVLRCWPVRPGDDVSAWAAALVLCAVGTALVAWRGPRPQGR